MNVKGAQEALAHRHEELMRKVDQLLSELGPVRKELLEIESMLISYKTELEDRRVRREQEAGLFLDDQEK